MAEWRIRKILWKKIEIFPKIYYDREEWDRMRQRFYTEEDVPYAGNKSYTVF